MILALTLKSYFLGENYSMIFTLTCFYTSHVRLGKLFSSFTSLQFPKIEILKFLFRGVLDLTTNRASDSSIRYLYK